MELSFDPRAHFNSWNASLTDPSYEGQKKPIATPVAAHYSENGILLPTVMHKVCNTNELRLHYFNHFILKKPVGTITSDYIVPISEDVAIHYGTYDFALTDEQKNKSDVSCDFTFVVRNTGKGLVYEHHHSSKITDSAKGTGQENWIVGTVNNLLLDRFENAERVLSAVVPVENKRLVGTHAEIVSLGNGKTLLCGHFSQFNLRKGDHTVYKSDYRYTVIGERGKIMRVQVSSNPEEKPDFVTLGDMGNMIESKRIVNFNPSL